MIAFVSGLITGAVILYLVLDNNPKLSAKLKVVKEIVKDKINKEQESNKAQVKTEVKNPNLYIQEQQGKK